MIVTVYLGGSGETLHPPICSYHFVIVLACPRPLRGQDAVGRIVGTIHDSQGGGIPKVTVAVTNSATHVSRTATSDSDGYFQILALPIGNYILTAHHDGFQDFTSTEHKLLINQTIKIDFAMAVSSLVSKVEVREKASNVETVDATLGQSVTSRALINMPLNGRDVLDLALLQPGVTESNDDNSAPGNFSIAGGRTDSVTYLLDGGQNNDLLDNSQLLNPNPDAIAEFRLLTRNYTAEYGRKTTKFVGRRLQDLVHNLVHS